VIAHSRGHALAACKLASAIKMV